MPDKQTGHHGHGSNETFVREWGDGFNSFNNWKGLLYSDHYRRIANKETLKAPVEARIDLTLRCNLNCQWCNSAVYRSRGDELDKEFVIKLINFLSEWGVKGICWAGGGEPTLHPHFTDVVEYAASKGLSQGLLSNGTAKNRRIHEATGRFMRWIGVSVDAGHQKTYKALKGADLYEQVMDNLWIMAESAREHESGCSVGYKFLISPDNQFEITTACERAKKIGVRDFIVRPMDTLHQGMTSHHIRTSDFNTRAIFDQFEKCHEMATADFHVFTVMHKFNLDFSHSKPFSQCYGAPLKVHVAPDANVYFCDDQFYRPEYCIGSCAKDPYHIFNLWGNDKHRQLLYGDTPKRCKTRCCIGDYNMQCERLFVNGDDPMCADFP